jgi:hypothetical protein
LGLEGIKETITFAHAKTKDAEVAQPVRAHDS